MGCRTPCVATKTIPERVGTEISPAVAGHPAEAPEPPRSAHELTQKALWRLGREDQGELSDSDCRQHRGVAYGETTGPPAANGRGPNGMVVAAGGAGGAVSVAMAPSWFFPQPAHQRRCPPSAANP